MRIDLHVHTSYSKDALIKPRELPEIAKRKGLNGVAIVDHNTLDGWKEVKNGSDFILISGIEIKTELGEIIGLFIKKEIKAHLFYEAVNEIRCQGGIVMLPHPLDTLKRNTFKIDSIEKNGLKEGIDIVEVFNARCALKKFNLKASQLAEELNKTKVAGSDAHFGIEIGNAYTIFPNAKNLDDIYAMLKMGKTRIYGTYSSPVVHALTLGLKVFHKLKIR